MVTCRVCAMSFERKGGRGPTPIYCSEACRSRRWNEERWPPRAPVTRTCGYCSVEFTFVPKRGPQRVYCSSECRRAKRAQSQAEQHRATYVPVRHSFECAVCSQSFTASRPNAKHCSRLCSSRALNARRAADGELAQRDAAKRERRAELRRQKAAEFGSPRQRYPHLFVAVDERRAARKADGERIPPREVYERDEWTCHLCVEPIDPTLKWPAPGSPSLDHVVPLALGGKHVRENVKAAHLVCNMRKGARVEEESA